MSTDDLGLRQRISDALLKASFADWDVGEGTVIEVPLTVAADAVMSVLTPLADAVAATETWDDMNKLISKLYTELGPPPARHDGEPVDPRRNQR